LRLLTSRDTTTLGGWLTSRCTWLGLAVELDQVGLEVGADGPHDLFHALEVPVGEGVVPVLRDGHEHHVHVYEERAASTGATAVLVGPGPYGALVCSSGTPTV